MMPYTHFSDCGQYKIIQVNNAYEQVVPVVPMPHSPTVTHMPLIEDDSPPKPKGFGGVAIGLFLGALALAIFTGGHGESDELVELRRENQYLRGRVDQLEYQLMGIYSAQ